METPLPGTAPWLRLARLGSARCTYRGTHMAHTKRHIHTHTSAALGLPSPTYMCTQHMNACTLTCTYHTQTTCTLHTYTQGTYAYTLSDTTPITPQHTHRHTHTALYFPWLYSTSFVSGLGVTGQRGWVTPRYWGRGPRHSPQHLLSRLAGAVGQPGYPGREGASPSAHWRETWPACAPATLHLLCLQAVACLDDWRRGLRGHRVPVHTLKSLPPRQPVRNPTVDGA